MYGAQLSAYVIDKVFYRNNDFMRLTSIFIFICLTTATARGSDQPNFLFFLVDDLGWADVGCNGSTFYQTPHIDSLATSGTRFTDGYAAASICSPTRASILTGRHPVRVNITDWIPGMSKTGKFEKVEDRDNLALSEVTIAETLRDAGYQTFFAGKWHLGEVGHFPEDQGFNINIGGHERGSPPGGYYAPWRNPKLVAKHDGEYLTERLTEETVSFINSQRTQDPPFFAYLSYYNVHTPIQPYKKRVGEYEEKLKGLKGETPIIEERNARSRGRQDNAELASMVAAVDDSVGRILAKLDEWQLSDNTVVIFFSDNGGLCTRPASSKKNGKGAAGPGCNLPLRAGKGWLYEGGIREAAIVRAPGKAQGIVCNTPMVSTDFYPTILELAGLPLQPELHVDGRSLVPFLDTEPKEQAERELYWHYPHYHGSGWAPGGAIRKGDWKLIEFWEYDDVELYDLSKDIGEQNDLSNQHPEKVRELQLALDNWRTSIGAVMPARTKQ